MPTHGASIVNLWMVKAPCSRGWFKMVGARHAILPQEESCPVPEDMLGQLYRASSQGLSELVATIPAGERAMLALYCYRRAHLQAIGLAIATGCTDRFTRDGWPCRQGVV